MTWLKSVLAGVAGVAFLILGAYRSGLRRERERQDAQRMAEHAESQGRRVDVLKKSSEVRDEIYHLPASAVDDRLRRWERKDN